MSIEESRIDAEQMRVIPYWVQTGEQQERGSLESKSPAALRLAILSCPRGDRRLDAEMRDLRESGVDILVSMLTAAELAQFGLTKEAEAAAKAGLMFKSVPVRDHGVPGSMQEFAAAVDEIRSELHQGKSIGAHCYAGIGRSCVLLACVLVREGWTPELAWERLSEARGFEVPDTPEQRIWVEDFAQAIAHPAPIKTS